MPEPLRKKNKEQPIPATATPMAKAGCVPPATPPDGAQGARRRRVGIVTIFDCDNYGADLQAYALPTALKALGHDAELIDYPFYKSPRFRPTRASRPALPLSPKNWLKESVARLLAAWRRRLGGATLRRRGQAFAAFRGRMPRSAATYPTFDALLRNPPAYDVYMTGSDQVWNPRMGATLRPYFLDFLPEAAYRVAYAASFGVAELPETAAVRFQGWLARYRAIGCREPRGVTLARSLCPNIPTAHTLDPTLLLSAHDWLGVARLPEAVRGKRYLLVYELVAAGGLTPFARRWARQEGLEVVRIHGSATEATRSGEIALRDVGPDGFVALFAHAKAVVTTSFHGTVFSLVFHVPFYSVIPRQMRNGSRQRGLLETVGLSDRLLPEAALAEASPTGAIDWATAQTRLQAAKEASLRFLRASVEGVGHAS